MSDTQINEVETTEPTEATAEVVTDAPEKGETPAPSADETKDDVEPTEGQVDKQEPERKELTEAEKIKFAYQKRVDRQGAKISELQRQLEETKALVEKYTPKQVDDAPKEDQFNSIEEYLIAKGKHEAKKEFEAQQAKAKQEAEQAAYAKTIAEKQQKLMQTEAEFRKTTPDYDDAVKTVNEFIAEADPRSTHVAIFRDFVMESDNPTPLLYKLGKNPELMEEMATMSPIKFAKELVKLELSLAVDRKPNAKPTVTPLTPVKGSSSNRDESNMGGRELLKRYKLK